MCANHVTGQTADAVSTGTDGVLLDVGDTAAVASNTAGITCGAFVAETRRGSKVQSCESGRLAESVSVRNRVSKGRTVQGSKNDLRAGNHTEVVEARCERRESTNGRTVGPCGAVRCTAGLTVTVRHRRSKQSGRESHIVGQSRRSRQVVQSDWWRELLLGLLRRTTEGRVGDVTC